MEQEESTRTTGTRHLLLIDERLNDIDTIIRSINRNTYCMVFNSTRDTMESILSKVRFLNDKNRVMLYKFYSCESEIIETIPTQMSLDTNTSTSINTVHCTPCDGFDMSTIRLVPSDVYSDLLIPESEPDLNHQTESSYPRVFFQRRSNAGSVLVSDLDELYNIGIQFGEVSDVDVPILASVGIMQHAEPAMSRFKLVNTLPDDVFGILTNVETCDPELKSWSFFIDFIRVLYATYHTTIVDLMACALYSNPNWKYVIDNLGSKIICDHTNNNNVTITIRASNDNTGASSLGGNWIMETADTDITTVYFTSDIHKWNYVLNMYIDNRFYFYRWNNSYASKSTTTSTTSGGYINLRNSSYTVEFWYYEETFSTNCTIIDRGDYEYTIQVHNEYTTNKQGIGIAPGFSNFQIIGNNSIVPTGVWTHVAVVRNKSVESNQYKIYINGELTDQITNTSNQDNAGAENATFAVGMQSPSTCACNLLKSGVYLYDLRIYKGRTKSQNEIRMGKNRVSTDTAGITFNAIMYEAGSGTKTAQLYDPYENSLAISGYAAENWKNTAINLPNIGLLIFNGGLLTGYNSSGTAFTLNGTHFGDMTYTNFQSRSLESVDFRGGSSMAYCDFYGAALSNANFTSKYLYACKFESTHGSSINFSSSTLNYSNFVSSSFSNCNFNYASMVLTDCNAATFLASSFLQTNMSSSTLTSVNFTGCTFQSTDITGSNLSNSILTNLYSSGVATNVGTQLPSGYTISSTGGYILGPNINFSSRTYTSTSDFGSKALYGINFSNSTLTSNNMTHSNLSQCIFTGSSLGNVNFSYSNLTNCAFTNAYLYYTNFTGATMTGVTSGGITTTDGLTLPTGYQIRNGYIIGAGVNVSGANLRNVNLASINLSNVNFNSVDLSGATLTNSTLSGASFSGTTAESFFGIISGGITANPAPTGLPSAIVFGGGYFISSGSSATNGNFTGIDFTSKTFTRVNFTGSTFTSVAFNNSTIISCNFTNTTLNNASFNGSNLTSSSLYGATINASTDLRNATLNSLQSGRINGVTTLLPANYTMI
jgi:uncharacterized protein YjbI with pentapeptide repeats